MTLRERIARLYRLHPRGERAETGPRRGKAPTGLTWLAREDRRVTVSDWVREALAERLERETGARSRGREPAEAGASSA